MEFKEYQSKKNDLLKEIKKIELEYVRTVTKLKVGDKVKFIEPGDSYIGEKDTKHQGIIYGFDIRSDGKITVRCKGIHYEPLLENVKN
jgi:hypothetical protein|tara:strand:- start:400 stop:663 length:264 start_codon:yes stop_codon:yes gene_type:complete